MTATDGLKIRTDSETIQDARRGMMEFLLVNHPLDCPICDRGGECMLQRYSVEYGTGTARTTDVRRRMQKPQFDPLIDIERNRCIMCTRCVRFCDEVAGDHVMGIFGHGNRNYIGTFGDGPVSNVFSGNVIDLCPVGCLTSKPFRFQARVWELRQTPTTTRTCNGPVTAWTRGGKLHRVTPPARLRNGLYTINEDTTRFISNEARFGSMHANHGDRLLKCLVRRKGELVETTWDEAMNAASGALGACETDDACFLAGERGTNEEFYLLARLARAFCKTRQIDWRSRFVTEDAAQAAGRALGASDADFDLLDKGAYGTTLMINADLLGSAPDIALRIKEAARKGSTKLALLDSRIDPWFARHAKSACLEPPEVLAEKVNAIAQAFESGSPADAGPEGCEALYKLMSESDQGLVVLGLDNAGGALNPALVSATLRLMRALGEGWHFLAATAARNAKGAFHTGAQSDRLPAGSLHDNRALQKTATEWGVELDTPQQAGSAAPELLRMAAEGKFKVLFLHRCDELVHHPNRDLIEQALQATPTVIALDVFPSWIIELATIVLPGAMFYETDGSMTDIDGTLVRMSRGATSPGDAQEDWRILESLCDLLGATKRYRQAGEIFGDLGYAWDAPQPMTLDDLTLESPGQQTPQVHSRVATYRTRPNFKLHACDRNSSSDSPSAGADVGDGGLRLLWIQAAQGPDHLGSRSSEYDALRPEARIELNPQDAERLGLAEGDWVRIAKGSGQAARVAINPYLASGVAHGAANALGLRLEASESGLPGIALEKTDDLPQMQPVGEENR